MFARPLALVIASCLIPAVLQGGDAPSSELSTEEMEHIKDIYQGIKNDEAVRKARVNHRKAVRAYHEALEKAMLEKDADIEPQLQRMKMNLTQFADAVWRSRDSEFLKTLHYPVKLLSKEERQRWDAAMKKLCREDFAREFQQTVAVERHKQDKIRKEYSRQLASFRRLAKKKLLELDPGLEPIIAKLEQPVAKAGKANRASGHKEVSEPEFMPTPQVDADYPDCSDKTPESPDGSDPQESEKPVVLDSDLLDAGDRTEDDAL